MNYRKLGNTDLNVSTICLGTMTWGEQNTQDEGFEQMDYALDQGVNFWDTAELYSVPPKEKTFGHTETIIGNWFKKTKKRNEVILATKVCGPMRSYVRGGGNQYGKKNLSPSKNLISIVGSLAFRKEEKFISILARCLNEAKIIAENFLPEYGVNQFEVPTSAKDLNA